MIHKIRYTDSLYNWTAYVYINKNLWMKFHKVYK